MSKILQIVRRTNFEDSIEATLQCISKKLEPNNIVANKAEIRIDKHIATAIINPMSILVKDGHSILLGHISGNSRNWQTPLAPNPDGAYALLRNNGQVTEIVTDSVASRTMWYYHDDDFFLASTSQRAIILYLGNFEFEEKVIPWLLSTGSLGPIYSWDQRILRAPVDSSISLNRDSWELTVNSNTNDFVPNKENLVASKEKLEKTLKSNFKSISSQLSTWTLPLSGGYDSRGILYFMLDVIKDRSSLKTITWGLSSSPEIEGNDAFIAKKIVKALSVPHKYYTTNVTNEQPIKETIERFILLGEGRIDHISGYMDGFRIWKTLFEKGEQGIIRGDEGFGWVEVSSAINVRLSTESALCSDFTNFKNLDKKYLFSQEFPERLKKQEKETLKTWRDRIYHEYRIPTIIAALSDLKLAYIEQVTPLLSNSILSEIRQLPDKFRTDKFLFRKIVNQFKPKFEYAKSGAINTPQNVLGNSEIVILLQRAIQSDTAKNLFSTDFLEEVISGLKSNENKKAIKPPRLSILQAIKKNTPSFIKHFIRSKVPVTINPNILAFRIYIIVFMYDLFQSESKDISK